MLTKDEVEKKLRRLGPTPLKILEHVLTYQTPTSAGTISVMQPDFTVDLNRQVGAGYSVLSRNNLVEPMGRDANGSLKWAPTKVVAENKSEILDLIVKLK